MEAKIKNNQDDAFFSKKTDENQSTERNAFDNYVHNNTKEFTSQGNTGSKKNTTGIPDDVKTNMESAFGADFSDVKVHSSSETAEQLGAIAFTKGNNIHFKSGEFNPATNKGKETLGHELTHVVQQRSGLVSPTTELDGININTDNKFENQADALGKMAANNQQVSLGGDSSGVATSNVSQMLFGFGSSESTNDDELTLSNVKKKLGLGTFSRTGKNLKGILKQVSLYEKTAKKVVQTKKSYDFVTAALQKKLFKQELTTLVTEGHINLRNLKDLIEIYLSRHAEDKSRTKRKGALNDILNLIIHEQLALNSMGVGDPGDLITDEAEESSKSNKAAKDIKTARKQRQTYAKNISPVLATNAINNYIKAKTLDAVLAIFGVGIADKKMAQEALELRNELRKRVARQINKEIRESTEDNKYKRGAKKYREELAKESQQGIIDDIAKTKAGAIVEKFTTSGKNDIKAKIEKIILAAPLSDSEKTLEKKGYQAALGSEKDITKKAVDYTMAGIKPDQDTEDEDNILKELKSSVTEKTKAKGLGTKEVEKRKEKDTDINSVVTTAFVKGVIKSVIADPISAKLGYKLGKSRKWLRKNSGSRKFRQDLKDTARGTSAEEIHQKVETNSEVEGQARKKFVEMQAQSIAYSGVKKHVDDITQKKINKIIRGLTNPKKKQIKNSAINELYGLLRASENVSEKEKIKAATKGAKNEARKVYKGIETDAISKADNLLSSSVDSTERKDLRTEVTSEVKSKYDFDATIKKVVKAENVGKAMKVLGGVIDTAVPSKGQSASIEVEFKLPFEINGVEVYFSLTYAGEAERDSEKDGRNVKESLMARSELTFGFGVEVAKLLDVSVHFGAFIEASAKNSSHLMDLISYGLYRALKRGGKPVRQFADKVWGKGGKTMKLDPNTHKAIGKYSKEEEAEIWAATVEEKVFKDAQSGGDAYVDVGWLGKAKADVNVGIGKLGLEAKYSRFSRIAKDTLKDAHGNSIVGKIDKSQEEIRRANKGKRLSEFEIGGELEFLDDALSGSISGKRTAIVRGANPSEKGPIAYEFDGEFKVIAALGTDTSKWVNVLGKYIAGVAAPVTKFVKLFNNRDRDDAKKRGFGDTIHGASDLTAPLTGIGDGNDIAKNIIESQGTDFKDAVMDQDNPLFSAKSSLGLGIHFGLTRDKPTDSWKKEFEISLLQIKSFGLDSGVIRAEVESSTRLGKLSWDSEDGWGGGLLGFGDY